MAGFSLFDALPMIASSSLSSLPPMLEFNNRRLLWHCMDRSSWPISFSVIFFVISFRRYDRNDSLKSRGRRQLYRCNSIDNSDCESLPGAKRLDSNFCCTVDCQCFLSQSISKLEWPLGDF